MSNYSPTQTADNYAAYLENLKARPSLSIVQAAELANVSKSTVRRAIDAGELPVKRLGRRVLVNTAATLAWTAGDNVQVQS
jgi:excisionase family DNA binding protein